MTAKDIETFQIRAIRLAKSITKSAEKLFGINIEKIVRSFLENVYYIIYIYNNNHFL